MSMTRATNGWVRFVLPVIGMSVGLAGCGAVPQPLKEAPPLTRSASCQVGDQGIAGRASSTPQEAIVMNNDGGWCWVFNSGVMWGRQYGPWLKLTVPPGYGEVAIAVTEDQTRVAYRPKPGFVGEDMFQTVDETTNFRAAYRVTVLR